MTQTLQIGPFVLPLALLLAAAAWLLAGAVGRRVARADAAAFDRHAWFGLLIGLLAARLAFVVQFHEAYLAAPLDIVDIRDGGWHAGFGIAAALGYLVVALMRRSTLRRPIAAALVVGAGIWFAGLLASSLRDATDVRLPPLALPSSEGSVVELASFKGRPTVVNLWATWCPPCRREMPVLQAAQAARPDIHFVFINQLESTQQVAAYLDDTGLTLRNVLLDGRGEAATTLGHRMLPTTLFFDAEGRLVDTRLGELSAGSLARQLADLTHSSSNR